MSFQEYLDFKVNNQLSKKELLDGYIKFGGFPVIALGDYEPQSAYQIANGIYYTVVSRDIVNRHRINRQDLFDRVIKYIIENVSKTFSGNSISDFIKASIGMYPSKASTTISAGSSRLSSSILVKDMTYRAKEY